MNMKLAFFPSDSMVRDRLKEEQKKKDLKSRDEITSDRRSMGVFLLTISSIAIRVRRF